MSLDPLTWEQAATLANITVRRLRQLVAEGEGPPPQGARFPVTAFADWLRRRLQGDTYDAERTRLTKAQADRTELEVAELRGAMVRIDDVVASWADQVSAARARLIGIPAKLAPRLADPSRVVEVERLIRDAVYEALHELAGDGVPDRARARAGQAPRSLGAAAAVDGESVGGRGAPPKPRKQRRARALADESG